MHHNFVFVFWCLIVSLSKGQRHITITPFSISVFVLDILVSCHISLSLTIILICVRTRYHVHTHLLLHSVIFQKQSLGVQSRY